MGSQRIFVLSNDQVSGPFSEQEVEQRLQNKEFERPMIWWRGLPDWLPPREWRQRLKEAQEKTLAKAERFWKMKVKERELAPMTHDQMLEALRSQESLSEVTLWTEGYEDWKEVFQIHPLMDELGVSRRKHPRVPLSGTVQIDVGGQSYEASPRTVSEGGVGVATTAPIKIGDRVSITLRSTQLYLGITTTAQVVYTDGKGNAGLKFEGLNSEGRAAIIEYGKRFKA